MRPERLLHHPRLLARAARAVAAGAAPYAAATLVVAAIVLWGSRLLLGPVLEAHPELVSGWLAQAVGRPVTIGALRAHWRGWTPEITADDFTVLGQGGEPTVRLRRIELEIDPLATLLAGAVRPGSARLDGLALALVREADGTVALKGVGDGTTQVDLLPALLNARAPVELVRSTVVWEDRGRGLAPVPLRDVTVTLRSAGDRHHLEAAAVLPGGHVRVIAETRGDLLAGAWDGATYLEARGLGLARWIGRVPSLSAAVRSGTADLALWVRWERGRVQEVSGTLGARRATLDVAGMPVNVATAGTRFLSRRLGDGWHLAVDGLRVDSDLGLLEVLGLEVRAGPQPALAPLLGFAEQVKLAPPSALAGAADGPPVWVDTVVRGLWAGYDPRQPGLSGLRLSASLERIEARANESGAQIQGLSGQLSVSGTRGRLQLGASPVSLDLPKVFPHPLSFSRLSGSLQWQQGDGRWLLSSPALQIENADLRVTLAGGVGARTAGEPDLYASLRGHLEGLDLQNLSRYLPERAMKPRAHAWLVHALRRGEVARADLLLHGPLADIPYHRASGNLEATAELARVDLDYQPPWPVITDTQATLSLRGPVLTIEVPSARMLDSPIGETHAEISGLGHEFPMLSVKGSATPSGKDALRVVREGPLPAVVKRRFDEVEIEASLGLELDLVLPLARDDLRVTEVDGRVAFRGNTTRLRGVELTQAEGSVTFTREGFATEGLRASLAGMPVAVVVEAATVDAQEVTRVRVTGTSSAAQVARALGGGSETPAWQAVVHRLRGTFAWQGVAAVPAGGGAGKPGATVTLSSDLRGLAVDLPLPLGKGETQVRALELMTVLGEGAERVLQLRYGDDVAATVSLSAGTGETRLAGAHVRLGPGSRPPPSAPRGLSLLGSLETLPLAAWGELIDALAEAGAGPATRRGQPQPAHIDLSAGGIDFGAHRLERVAVVADFDPTAGWSAHIEGEGARGRLRAAPAGSTEGVLVDLDRLSLLSIGGGSGGLSPPDPRGLPAVDFRCADFAYDGRALGTLSLSARPSADGLSVTGLRLVGALVEGEANGRWDWNGGDQRSQFTTSLSSPDLGKLLEALGYDDTGVKGGRSQMEVEARWAGAPTAFSLARANGRIQLKIEDGMLTEVKPGAAGRVFGLLSVWALPRRLTLDFRDLVGKGLRFDRIEGSFTLGEGNAHTEDLVVEGDAARIEVTGRVGLETQDYDQVVTVTPRVSTTLPIAGALAGGPAGAAVGLLAQGLLRNQIDRAAASRYTITGSWTDPQVTAVRSDPAAPQD